MTRVLAPLVLAAALTACAGADGVTITALDPPYGPVVGGTATTIVGTGFERGAADPLVLIDGREAPVVITIDDAHLTVLTPPGVDPGDVDVRVIVGDRAALTERAFRYSRPPVLDDVSPGDVSIEAGATRVRVHGAGFLDEGAGPPRFLVDGLDVEATVVGDGELDFVAPAGWPLREPELELINRRGSARRARAFRYVAPRPGLLLFTFDLTSFAVYYEPLDRRVVELPRFNTFVFLSSVVRADDGAYWGLDGSGRVGRVDSSDQVLLDVIDTGRPLGTLERVTDGFVAFDDAKGQLGRLSLATGGFAPLPLWPPGLGPCALAFDGARLYAGCLDPDTFVAGLRQVDPSTGEVGPPVTLDADPFFFIDEMRFAGGTLYATSGSALFTIDPATGATERLPLPPFSIGALATYE